MRSFEGSVIADRYRLDQYLDEGAFGAVYRSTHLAHGVELREVAIKLAKRPMIESEARRAFGEALLMTQVTDATPDATLRQHFISVYDAGRCPDNCPLAGHPYVVMELVRGGSLARGLRVGPFPLTRALSYFNQILRAMAFMHSDDGGLRQPITHRDLKPSNILVLRHANAPDIIKVTDFGVAVEVDSLIGWVESGGDLAYLAPESFSHNICSPQSDVYMLGLVFHEMLIGSNPFSEVGRHLSGDNEASRAELRRLHLVARQLETFPLLERHEEIRRRPQLGRVILTALQPEMHARTFQNAREFQRAWEQAQAGEGDLSPRSERAWETVRRLTGEAEQAFAVGDYKRGEALLGQAGEINRDARRVPDPMIIGRCYLLMVERLLKRGEVNEAGLLASEGYQRRRRRSTCLAMARYYEAQRSPVLAAEFARQAQASSNQD
jgi:hypothetical protein